MTEVEPEATFRDSVTYSMAYKRNVGNYESATAFYALTREVRPGESPDEAKAKVEAKVDAWVEAKIREIDNDAKV